MMKIAHISATFPPYQGGTGNVCFHNARQLARLGHEVHVFTASFSSAPALERSDGFTIHRLRPVVQVGNAPVLLQLVGVLRGFDLIHLHYPFILGAEMVRLASIIYRIPLVISFHNDLIAHGGRGQLFRVYQRFSAQLTVRGAERLGVVSNDHYDFSVLRRSLNGTELQVVELPNGVDIDQFCPNGTTDIRECYQIPTTAKLLLFVATLDRAHYFKGLGKLLQALQALPSDTWLLIVGDGELRSVYEEQAKALGIAQRTIFVGGIDNQAIAPFYRNADVTVLPSSPPESFGLVLIESLACGTPVIASDIPGVRTVVTTGQDGFLVELDNESDLVAKLQTMLSFPAHERQKMGMMGRSKVEKRYTWSQIGLKLERLYMELINPVISDQ